MRSESSESRRVCASSIRSILPLAASMSLGLSILLSMAERIFDLWVTSCVASDPARSICCSLAPWAHWRIPEKRDRHASIRDSATIALPRDILFDFRLWTCLLECSVSLHVRSLINCLLRPSCRTAHNLCKTSAGARKKTDTGEKHDVFLLLCAKDMAVMKGFPFTWVGSFCLRPRDTL
jgi:hypothetical protein